MAQIGSWFAQAFPQAQVVSVGAPYPASAPQGRQWYAEIPEHDRSQQQGVDAVMPSLSSRCVTGSSRAACGRKPPRWSVFAGRHHGAGRRKAQPDLAGRVVAFSGRYVTLPEQASTRNTIHLIHGDYDEQVPMQHAEAAMQRLTALGGDVTLDIVDDLPHAIDERSMQLALNHLRYTVPRRYFDEALSGRSRATMMW